MDKLFDVRKLSLKELSEVKRNKFVQFPKVVRTAFPGSQFTKLRNRIINGTSCDIDRSILMQGEYVDMLVSQLETVQKDVDQEEIFIKKKEEELAVAKEQFEIAKRAFEKAEATYKAALVVRKEFEGTYAALDEAVKREQKRLEVMSKYALIHQTATLNQIADCKDRIFVTTNLDTDMVMKSDAIFEVVETDLIENVPIQFADPELTDEYKDSVLGFAQMAMHYFLNEETDKIKLVYSDKLIAEVLRLNGFPDELL